MADYRVKISELGYRLNNYNANSLANYLENGGSISAEQINVVQFGTEQIVKLKTAKRDASAADMLKVVNSLQDYLKSDFAPITDIRAKFLEDYERYLKSPRKLTRLNQFKKPVTKNVKGLGKTELHNHMHDLRILFNNIVEHYNDEDSGIMVVKHYPFKKYKITKPGKTNKKKLSTKEVRIIRDCVVPENSRIELAKELSMLSFYLCGMNAVDLYNFEDTKYLPPRIDYNRSKTDSLREDNAFMSVKLRTSSDPAGIGEISFGANTTTINDGIGATDDDYTVQVVSFAVCIDSSTCTPAVIGYQGFSFSRSKGQMMLTPPPPTPTEDSFYYMRTAFDLALAQQAKREK